MILRSEYDIIKFVFELKDLDFSKPHLATVEPYDPKKTTAQCRLYWDWVDEIRKTTGEHKVHQDINLRELLLTPKICTNAKGEVKELYPSVSTMGKKQMSKFMDELFIMATKHGFNLKDPADLQRNE